MERLQPDVLCLQETKCQDDKFPLNAIRDMGFPHIALNGQKGWHGVATFSKPAVRGASRRGSSAARAMPATSR